MKDNPDGTGFESAALRFLKGRKSNGVSDLDVSSRELVNLRDRDCRVEKADNQDVKKKLIEFEKLEKRR